MERKQETYRIIFKITTSHEPEGNYDVIYLWANDRDSAREIFHTKKNNDGTLSSVSYEIIQIDSKDPIKIEDIL